MDVLANQALESHVSWDVEGWVKSALRAWARDYEEIEVARTLNGDLVILVEHDPIARVEVRKIPLASR